MRHGRRETRCAAGYICKPPHAALCVIDMMYIVYTDRRGVQPLTIVQVELGSDWQ